MWTVESLLDLVSLSKTFRIKINGYNEIFEFNSIDFPEEFLYMEVESVDTPLWNSATLSILMCINENQLEDGYDNFLEQYEDFIIN